MYIIICDSNTLVVVCVRRFCVGDRFYLCENKILCEYDYEERLVFANMATYNSSSLAHIRRQVSRLQVGHSMGQPYTLTPTHTSIHVAYTHRHTLHVHTDSWTRPAQLSNVINIFIFPPLRARCNHNNSSRPECRPTICIRHNIGTCRNRIASYRCTSADLCCFKIYTGQNE